MTPPYLPGLTADELLNYASNHAVTDLEKALVSVLGPAYDLSVKADALIGVVRAVVESGVSDTLGDALAMFDGEYV